MSGKTSAVSAFEAKTHLSELLREAERGRSFVIRRRGKAVARLVPPVREGRASDLVRIIASFREIRKRIPGRVKIRKLIEEGRRT
ncbi:MAG: type II toxin-antitoxin system prevent-host-death family antitoxin [Nitrospirae bacterium]|nr:type II toxin-antitoxin system prevent-host-death family antitoxin [Nitrospirota bacterium]